jgi:hypothetical protein
MWRLEQSDQKRCTNGDLAKQIRGIVLPAFGRQLSPGLLTQGS